MVKIGYIFFHHFLKQQKRAIFFKMPLGEQGFYPPPPPLFVRIENMYRNKTALLKKVALRKNIEINDQYFQLKPDFTQLNQAQCIKK